MEYQQIFDPGVKQHLFQFPLGDLNENLVIASYSTFSSGESFWAGDKAVRQGNWAYFDYTIKEHPINAGPDSSITITESVADAIPSWDEVRKLYAGQLAPGVDSKSGTYNPSIWELINEFNDPARASMQGEYTTTYTLGTGTCTDSALLAVKVVADDESI